MALNWKKTIAPLSLAFAAAVGLTGCDNAADIAAKPQLVQQMVSSSTSVCTTAEGSAAAQYAARLNSALDQVSASDIRTLSDNHITVCLDQRLDSQNAGFWDTRAQGVLTRDADGKGGIATIWDDGAQPKEGAFFLRGAAMHSGNILHAFASRLEDGDVAPGSRWIAFDDSVATADGGYIEDSAAKPAAQFDKDTLAKNPFLLQAAPVKQAPLAPKPGT